MLASTAAVEDEGRQRASVESTGKNKEKFSDGHLLTMRGVGDIIVLRRFEERGGARLRITDAAKTLTSSLAK